MGTKNKNLSAVPNITLEKADTLKIAILTSEYNGHITNGLLKDAKEYLLNNGIQSLNLIIEYVPGAYELPSGAQVILEKFSPDAVITLGCVIKGETDHDIFINQAISSSIIQLALFYKRPVIFGVLTTNTEQQAIDRAGGKKGSKGVESAYACLKMLALHQKKKPKEGIGF